MTPGLRQILLGRNSRLSAHRYGPTNPLYIAHRGGPQLYPENTMEAYTGAYAAGVVALEQDVQLLSDGAGCVMHDTTVTRTTTSTGNVVDLNTAGWRALNIDAGTQMGGGFSDTIHPPLFDDVLAAYKGKILFMPEAKVTGTPALVVAALQAAGVPRDQAIVQGFTTTAPALAVQNGYQGMYLTSTTTAEIPTVKAAGIQWVGLDAGLASDANFQSWLDAGFKVVAWVVNRRYRRDQLLPLKLSGFFSDDPIYLAQAQPPATADNFAAQVWSPGMFAGGGALDETVRGRFQAPNYWGWATTDANTRFVLQGWACPILNKPNPTDFSINFSVKFGATADATRWVSLFLADDALFGDRGFLNNGSDGSYGYHFLMRKTGSLEIYRKDNGVDAGVGANTATVAIADGEEVKYRVTITPTTVNLYRLDADGNIAYTNSKSETTYRGGYFHLGHAAVGALFRSITIVPT